MTRTKIFTMSVIVALSGLFSDVSAYNHPEIKWKTVATKHFLIHYYDRTEPLVYATWKIAEEAFESLAPVYDYTFIDKINISIADYDDYSNGWAAWTERNIGIWAPDASMELRGNNTWLRNVIAHELSHIISMEKKKGMQLFDWMIALDYASPSLNLTLTEPIPFLQTVPNWFAEGTAQAGSEYMSGDCRDSRREMATRCAALSKRLLTLNEMGVFTHDWVGNEMVYNQGYSFFNFLVNRYGQNRVAGIWSNIRGKKFGGGKFSSIAAEKLGSDLDSLYRIWSDSLYKAAAAKVSSPVTETVPVRRHGNYNARPRISPDGKFTGFLSNQGDDGLRTDLVVLDQNGRDEVFRIKHARVAWDFSSDSRSIYYVKTRRPNQNGSFYNELYRFDMESGSEILVEKSARIYELACSPSGKSIACVRYQNGVFNLDVYDIAARHFETLVAGVAGDPFLHLCWQPSSDENLLVSRLVNGQSDIFSVNTSDKSITSVMATPAQEESPFCDADSTIYFSADYDGVFNVYSVLPDGSTLKRHTNVTGGAFSPVVSAGRIIISEYTADGFGISSCSPQDLSYQPDSAAACVFKSLPVPKGKVTIDARPYSPKLLRPVCEITTAVQVVDTGDILVKAAGGGYDGNPAADLNGALGASFVMYKSDALAKKSMYMGVGAQIMPIWSDSTQALSGNSVGSSVKVLPLNAKNPARLAIPYRARLDEKRSRAMIQQPAFTIGSVAGLSAAAGQDSSGQGGVTFLPLLVPMLGVTNSQNRATIGIELQVALLTMIPVDILLSPFIEWQIARDMHIGVSPVLEIAPLAIVTDQANAGFKFSMPLWYSFSTYGYYNQDISYNLGDVTAFQVSAGPQFEPVFSTGYDIDGELDTSITTGAFFFAGLDFLHGFRLTRYSCLSVGTGDYFLLSGTEISDPMGLIDGAGSVYTMLSASARLAFPIVRNINSGALYADNLYGNVSYEAGLYCGGRFFEEWNLADSSICALSHTFGIGVDLGFIKKYLFNRKLGVKAAYEAVNQKFSFTLRVL